MPKVAYSEEDRERIRAELVTVGLELMANKAYSIQPWSKYTKELAYHVLSSILFSQQKKI